VLPELLGEVVELAPSELLQAAPIKVSASIDADNVYTAERIRILPPVIAVWVIHSRSVESVPVH
jgi:hypothetical protein